MVPQLGIHQRSLVSRSEQQSKRRLRLALRGTATYRSKREPFSSMPHNPRTSYTGSQQPRGATSTICSESPATLQRFPRKPRDRRVTPESQLPPVDLAPDHPGPRPTVLVARTSICACCVLSILMTCRARSAVPCGAWRCPLLDFWTPPVHLRGAASFALPHKLDEARRTLHSSVRLRRAAAGQSPVSAASRHPDPD